MKNNEAVAKATIEMSKTNEGIYKNGEVVTRLTMTARTETEAINRLTKESLRDSRFIKILTFIALLYLPASLIAVAPPSFQSLSLQMLNLRKHLDVYSSVQLTIVIISDSI